MLLQLHSGGPQSVDRRTPLANWDDLPTSGSLGGFTAMTSAITNGSFVVVLDRTKNAVASHNHAIGILAGLPRQSTRRRGHAWLDEPKAMSSCLPMYVTCAHKETPR
jgi:hypothetical protein